MQDIPDTEVTINDELYYIEEGLTGWSYFRANHDHELEEDSGKDFKTHTDAIQAAMEHERTRDELIADNVLEYKEHRERVMYHRGL